MKRRSLLKTVSMVALATTVMTFSPVSANAAWKQNSIGWWFTEGNSYATGWRQINGTWYFFDSNGYMKTGWVKDGGSWYYMNSSGAMMTGWVKDGGSWYYMNSSGVMQTGWVKDGADWYYMNNSGVMQTGWINDGSKKYFLDEHGVMLRNTWINDHSYNYYLVGSTGAMVTGFYEHIDGYTYCFDNNGILTTNDIVNGYFINKDGVVCNKVNNLYTEAELQEMIIKEDSEFIKDFQNRQGNSILLPTRIYRTSAIFKGYENIEDEIVYLVTLCNPDNDYDYESYAYMIGETSGKVYRTINNFGHDIFELKDNKVVNTYTYTGK